MTTTHGFQDPTPIECKGFTKFVNNKVWTDFIIIYMYKSNRLSFVRFSNSIRAKVYKS